MGFYEENTTYYVTAQRIREKIAAVSLLIETVVRGDVSQVEPE